MRDRDAPRQTAALVLCAVRTASGGEGARLADVIAGGDYLGRLILTRDELEESVNRLLAGSLLRIESDLFYLTDASRTLLVGVEADFQGWEMVRQVAGELDGDAPSSGAWRLDAAVYEDGKRAYREEFNAAVAAVEHRRSADAPPDGSRA
jgi:hypothetical protein